jgi:RimJ/RimL family protein N-acetyltransferase
MTMILNRKPPNYFKDVVLADGRHITVRPIGPQDKDALQAFHTRLSGETRFLRYHYSKGALTEKDLKDFCDLDYYEAVALVAEMEVEGEKQIIGVGRYNRLPIPHAAEVAFVVQDNEQNKGIGTELLKHLSTLAWQQEIRYFVGEVLRQNSRMLKVFRNSDPRMSQEVDSNTTCNVTISVAEAMR